MQILATWKTCTGKTIWYAYINNGFRLKDVPTSWSSMGQNRSVHPPALPAGIRTFQEVQRERAWQIWGCLVMSCAFNLLKNLRKSCAHRVLLTMILCHIHRSLAHSRRKRNSHLTTRSLFKCHSPGSGTCCSWNSAAFWQNREEINNHQTVDYRLGEVVKIKSEKHYDRPDCPGMVIVMQYIQTCYSHIVSVVLLMWQNKGRRGKTRPHKRTGMNTHWCTWQHTC